MFWPRLSKVQIGLIQVKFGIVHYLNWLCFLATVAPNRLKLQLPHITISVMRGGMCVYLGAVLFRCHRGGVYLRAAFSQVSMDCILYQSTLSEFCEWMYISVRTCIMLCII